MQKILDFLELLLGLLIFLVHVIISFLQSLGSLILPTSKKSLSDEIILITGAASGIGRLQAYNFCWQGARLIVCWDINQSENEKTAETIKNKYGGKAIALKCDLSQGYEEVQKVAAETRKLIQKELIHSAKQPFVSMLVNNAGVVFGKKLLDASPKQIQLTMDINATAHFYTIKEFLPEMIQNRKGHIVNIASICGLAGNSQLTDYCSSKFAAVGLAESLFVELRKAGHDFIKQTTICPYVINTGMFQGFKYKYDWLIPDIQPQEMADVIVDSVRAEKNMVIYPKLFYLVYYLKPLLGNELYWKLNNLIKTDECMTAYIGRK